MKLSRCNRDCQFLRLKNNIQAQIAGKLLWNILLSKLVNISVRFFMGSCLLKNFHFVILLLYSCSKEQESGKEGGSIKKLNNF